MGDMQDSVPAELRRSIRATLAPRLDWSHTPPWSYSASDPDDDWFAVNCPNGHTVTVPATLKQVRVTGASMNVAVTCPECHSTFDAAPGDDVVINTHRGRVTVREVVAALKDLRRVVKAAPVEDVVALRQTLSTSQGLAQLRATGSVLDDWLSANPKVAAFLIDKGVDVFVALIFFWLGTQAQHADEPSAPPPPPAQPAIIIRELNVHVDHEPSDEELEEIVRRAVRRGLRDAEQSEGGEPN